MSIKLIGYVWDGCVVLGMKLFSVVIMVCLVDFSNDEGVCWLLIEIIVCQIGVGMSIVRMVIVWLEVEGWLMCKVCCQGDGLLFFVLWWMNIMSMLQMCFIL